MEGNPVIRSLLLAGALAAGAFTVQPAQAIACSPVAADVCATIGFVCGRLEYHRIYECDLAA
jgi:hypothetical protein